MTAETIATLIRDRVQSSIAVHESLLDPERAEFVSRAARLVTEALRGGNKVLLFGNGGSAADAMHIAAELLGRFCRDRASLPALALGGNIAALTAIGNDTSFDEIFAREVQGLGVSGDVAIGLSTSGESENIIRALQAAQNQGLFTIGFTGASSERLRSASNVCISVPSTETARVQEAHMLIGHIVCEIVEQDLFPE